MNIKLTKDEAAKLLGPVMQDKLYPATVTVEVVDAPGGIPAYVPPPVSERLSEIRTAFRRGEGGYLNKIGMIKEVRTVTGWGLKDSKDFVETILDALDVGYVPQPYRP